MVAAGSTRVKLRVWVAASAPIDRAGDREGRADEAALRRSGSASGPT